MCEHINDDAGSGGVHQLGTKNKLFNYKLDSLDGLDEILKNFTNKKKQWQQQEQHVLLQNNNNNNNISAGTLKLNNNNNNTPQQQQAFDENQVTDISSNNQPILFEIATTSSVTSSSPEKSSSSVTLSSSCSSSSSPSTTDLSTHMLPAVVDHHHHHQQQQQQQQQMSQIGRDGNLITCMLITANVGTIFEESTLLELWFEQLKSYLVKIKPQLVAIHCQEVGGKNFETSMKNVSGFTDKILGDPAIIGDYSRVRIFLDENYDCLEKFTALGSLYLVHDSVDNVKLYNFKTAQYDVIEPGRDIFAVSDKKDLLITKTSTTTTAPEATSKTTTTTETSIKINIKQASESNNCSNNNVQEQQQQQQQQESNEEILGQEKEQRQYCYRLKNAKLTQHVEKIKFPIELFPECRWSRKGFMRTRWLFNDCQPLDLVNIHLFHDASNLVAMKTTPSPYAQNRQKALEFALKKLAEPLDQKSLSCIDNNNESAAILRGNVSHTVHKIIPESETTSSLYTNQQQVPLFIFGDFNFRLDTNKVIQRITEGISPIVKKNAASNEVVEFVYHRKISNCSASSAVVPSSSSPPPPPPPVAMDGVQLLSISGVASEVNNVDEQQEEEEQEESPLMTVGKKLFDYRDLDETFRATKNTEWLLEMDNELDSFRSQLYEFKISFSPSYPFKEDETGGYSYMKTRCPAWCDRILFNAAGYKIISSGHDIDESKNETTTSSSGNAANVQNILDSEKIELLQDHSDVIYRLMGNSVPMGDHKPVLLYCQLNISPKQQLQQLEPKLQLNPSLIKCNQSESTTNQQQVVTSATSVTGAIKESQSDRGAAGLQESTTM